MIIMLYVLVGILVSQFFIALVFLYNMRGLLKELDNTLDMIWKDTCHKEETQNDHAS